eukprot:jgi/Chlat1/8567/Chrsp82S00654
MLRQARWPDEIILMVIALLPIVELRGAVPVGHWMGVGQLKNWSLSVIGNMVPVPFVLRYLGPVSEALMARSDAAKSFFDWLFKRTRNKAQDITSQEWRALGLMIFVAIPLPLTGAWSGAIAAYLLDMPFWESFWAILLGVMIAGIIMLVVVALGWIGAAIAGVALMALVGGGFLTAMKTRHSQTA